eukprot:s4331_g4.t1
MHNLKTPERLLHAEDDLNAVDVEGEVRWPSDDAIEALFGDLNHEELCDAWGVKPNAETMKDDKKEKETVAAAQLYSRVLEEVDAEDFQFFAKEAKNGSTNGSFGGSAGTPHQASLRHRSYGTGFSAVMTVSPEESRLDLLNAESVMAQIDAAQIDLLFDRSAGLELKAVLHFLSQLIQAGGPTGEAAEAEELACEEMPRIFSLQKLVEVSIGNLMRPPEVWSEIWRTVSRHLADVASHHNVSIGLYAINCLKQLAMKFLEREEEAFGQVLLEPFEKLMKSKSASPDVKGLVVSSVDFMVEHRSSSIKAGWAQERRAAPSLPPFFADPKSNKEVLDAAFAIMKIAVASRNFAKSVHALLAFGHCRFAAISFQALQMLRQMADDLQSGSGTQTAETEERMANAGLSATDWLLLLNGMTSMIGDLRQEVSVRATVTAFQCLRDVGAKSFDAATWSKVIESVVEPVCEKVTGQLQQGDSKMATAVAEFILPDLEELPTKTLLRYLPQIFPVLARLVTVPSPEVRHHVQTMLRRLCPLVAPRQEVERGSQAYSHDSATVSYAVTLKGRWRAQERPHVPLELLRAPLQVGEPVELWSRSSFKWLLAEVDGLEATTALLRHYKVRVFGQEAVAVAEASYLRRRFLKGSAVEVYRGPSRGWICTRVSDRAPLGGCDFASPADGDPVDEAEGEVTWPSAEPPLELWEPQSDGRRGAPPRKSDGSRFQPCDFVAMIPVLKEFAVSPEEVEEVPSFLLRPAASSPSCPSQVFQI